MTEKLPKKEESLKIIKEEPKKIKSENKPKEIECEEKKVEASEVTKKELKENLIRLQAEFENYRKRVEKELRERSEIGKIGFAKSMLQLVDEFENALAHFECEHKKGMEMLLSNLKKTLEMEGVWEMKCENEKYDPYKHEVILQQESEKPEGTIIAVVRKGYFFKDHVLRHAQVIIAKKKENDSKKGE